MAVSVQLRSGALFKSDASRFFVLCTLYIYYTQKNVTVIMLVLALTWKQG